VNASLYRLVRAVQRGEGHLGRILVHGVLDGEAPAPMIAGVYLAATGAREGERAFAEGVFRKVIDSQDMVSWTTEALARDRALRRRAAWGFAAIALGYVALLATAVVLLWGR
jgi:hypothetical protein